MPISRTFIVGVAAGVLVTGAAAAFDLQSLDADTPPADAFRYGVTSYRAGDARAAAEAFGYAAEGNITGAQWKLGRMYADGDGVERNPLRAYELLSEVANNYLDEETETHPQEPTPYELDALVQVGTFLASGIPDSDVKADPLQARAYYERAALFGNADAQFRLAQMYYSGEGGERDAHRAAQWANLAMEKGHNGARALLGHLLFEGEGVTRQPLRGLTFLTIAARLAGASDLTILRMHERARAVANEPVWNQARLDADTWIQEHMPHKTAELAPFTQ